MSRRPIELPHVWEDEPGRQHCSGAATYTTSFDLNAVDSRVSIDFGDCEVLDGSNAERGLVGPNALAADEHIRQLAAESEARYGRRFQMHDLDRALESVRSGLLRIPTIVLIRGD